MIPRDYITEWRARAPWIQDAQVEQDLVISRALVEIYRNQQLGTALALRGGTALYKLHITPAARYSEDIDLVQTQAEPIGETLDLLRSVLDPWLGQPQRKQSEGRVTLSYRFESEDRPPVPLRLKIEINSREHFSIFGTTQRLFRVASRWFSGSANILTYELDELLGTKVRALYQRRKGRDLFDLALAIERTSCDPARIITAFHGYMEREGNHVTRAQFERNLAAKLTSPMFTADMQPLLASGYEWNAQETAAIVSSQLVARLPGDPWKGDETNA